MEREKTWIITRVDGLIASVSIDYKGAAALLAKMSAFSPSKYAKVETAKISTPELFDLAASARWEDLLLFGTPFQQMVWKALFDLTHPSDQSVRLISYSEFAESLGKGPGVRAVAHAVGLNPVSVIIPCHLIIPKESIERLHDLNEEENGLFKRETLYMVDRYIDYGEYQFGTALKRDLIHIHLNR
ncbi:MAG: methylated-DNA--[Bacteroidales bacterium]|nr:methylated-DNA--[protein]-cysteine S-methyltransferase [Bacteroidales bacterium]MBQ9186122.1 methylated-DNA--[protein]-cysteine S-methyltransferase [Bacteroidales bacterium]